MKKQNFLILFLVISILFFINNSYAQKIIRDVYHPIIVKKNPSPNQAAYSVVQVDFTVTLRDGVILDCSKFFPSVSDPNFPNGYPTLILCHGYGGSKLEVAADAKSQASEGYSCYTFSMRGQGNSGGLSNLISRVEALDLIEYINCVRHDNTARRDSSKIMVEGGSQGGTIPYMAACMGMNVKAIIADLMSPYIGTTWIENNSIKMTFLWTISYTPDIARYDDLVNAMRGWVYADTPDKMDSLNYWEPLDRDFNTLIPQNQVPMFIENSWQDKFFNSLGNISTIPLLSVPKRYYFGAVDGHGGETSTTENKLINRLWDDWYNYWLLGINSGILTRPKFFFAYTTFPLINTKWTFVHDSSAVWPPANTTDLKLYFNPNGKISTTPNPVDTQNVVLVNNVTGGLTMQTAVDMAFKGTQFNNKFKKAQLIFDSNPLTQDLKMFGDQYINLDYSSNVYKCQFNFQIYEVNNSTQKLVTRANYTNWHNIPNTRTVKSFYGLSHSHIFKTGNKIRIILTNLDTSPADDKKFLATNPHVLPSLVNGNHKMFLSSNSYLDLKFIPPASGMNLSYFGESTNSLNDESNNSNPYSFKLNQNFPNPFNPSTVIEFSIPANEFVSLKIYDVSGRKIATLINEQKAPGKYSVNFNADAFKLASGIYYYKLSAGQLASVKKLILIK
jgi:predicted acyl esterase